MIEQCGPGSKQTAIGAYLATILNFLPLFLIVELMNVIESESLNRKKCVCTCGAHTCMCIYLHIDRHYCLKSGNIPKTVGGLWGHLCDNFMISIKFKQHKKKVLLELMYLTESMPLLTTTTVLIYMTVPRLSPLPQLLRNVVEKLYILKTHQELPYTHTHTYIYIYTQRN